MRVLALLFALLSLPVLAAEYTPWPASDEPAGLELAQAPPAGKGQAPGQGGGGGGKPTPSLSGSDYPGRYCCVHCRHNETPCGGECVANTAGAKMCAKPAGCACAGKP